MHKVGYQLIFSAGLVLLVGCSGATTSSEPALARVTTENTRAETPIVTATLPFVKPPPTFVPQSAPVWISIEPGILPQTMLNPDGIRTINGAPIVPVDNRPVFRTDSNQPGTDSPGTSFVIGHNWVDPTGAAVPFAALEKVRSGDTVILGTANGVLSYSVVEIVHVPKKELPNRVDLHENVPGRLVLATCDTTPFGEDTTDNLVIITELDR